MLLCAFLLSLPLWECGLKSYDEIVAYENAGVTPLVGVWIEIAWSDWTRMITTSLPLWECGLKYDECDTLACPPSHSPCGSVD